jgi:hypothetical protein
VGLSLKMRELESLILREGSVAEGAPRLNSFRVLNLFCFEPRVAPHSRRNPGLNYAIALR